MKKLFFLLVVLTWVACDNTAVPGTTSPSVIGETDSLRFAWIGDFAAEPYVCDAIHEYDAYRNTTDGAGYFCDGTAWRLIAQDGVNGSNGSNGVSIQWLGSFDSDPASPLLNQAYFNTVTGNSYIYNGSAWVILVQGRYLKVIDGNSNYLGYAIGTGYAYTSKGYLLGFHIVDSEPTEVHYNSPDGSYTPVFFSGLNCTGSVRVRHEFYNQAALGGLIYNKIANQFYKRKSTALTAMSYQSYYYEATGTDGQCSNAPGSATGYEYEAISRTDAGLPATIVPPFTFLFQ